MADFDIGGSMARKRMIDPEIWTDERFAVLSEGEQIFFVALFSQADDEGRYEWSAMQFKLRCSPASAHSPQVFEDRKSAIVNCGLAHQYSVNGRVYLLLPGWFNTQKLERGAISKIPDPPDLSTNPTLSDYFTALQTVREWQNKRLKDSDGQKMPENGRECPLEEKRREEKRKEKNDPVVAPAAPPVFPEPIETEVVGYLALVAAENKSGKITAGREANERRTLAEVRAEVGDDTVFIAALRETNRREKPHENYLRSVAEGIAKRGKLSTVPPRREIHGYLNGEKCAIASMADAPNGWTDVPPRNPRKPMAELWPEHSKYGSDYEPPNPFAEAS